MTKHKILIAGHHCGNLSESAGFEQVTRFIPYDTVDANQFWFANAEFGTIPKKLNLAVYESYLRSIIGKYDLVHFLLPEVHLTFSLPSNKKSIAVGTIHLPLDQFLPKNLESAGRIMAMRKNTFDRLDAIVTLTKANEKEIKEFFPQADVKFIPHGVYDYSSYYVEKSSGDFLNIITAGTNFRDLELYKSIVQYALKNKPNWKFNILGAGKWKSALQNFSNVNIYPYLPETDYLKLLAKSDVHFLPLTFATANNALLEAHSVGIPTLVSNLESVRDYALSTTQYFGNLDSLIHELSSFEELGLNAFNEIKKATLRESIKFHWQRVAKELTSYYDYLLRG